MADEQTPQSDLIDDAIRQAERQLEAKLEALRMSAMADPAPRRPAPASDVAVLRPVSSSRASEPVAAASVWQEAPGEDLTFAPSERDVTLAGGDLYVPDHAEDEAYAEEAAPQSTAWADAEATDGPIADPHGLVTVWEDAASAPDPEPEATEPSHRAMPEPAPMRAYDTPHEPTPPVQATPEPQPSWSRTEAPAWTGSASRSTTPEPAAAAPELPNGVPSVPSEEELQFWAHTRTALRNLQQSTEVVPGVVATNVASEVERVVRDELAPTGATLRLVQQQVQQGLPKLAERVEGAIEEAMVRPNAELGRLREELPEQLDRTVLDTRASVREDLDHAVATVHGAVQHDIARLEESVASNVTRMTQGTNDAVARVERDLELLGEGVSRFERGIASEMERVERDLQTSIARAEGSLREQLAAPTDTIRKLDSELPGRLSSVEQTLVEQVQSTQRDLSSVLVNLVDANRASLDRVAAIASTLDEDRARRAEDVEVIVDTVTTGWEGLAGAVKALYEQQEGTARRIEAIEQRLGQLRDLEFAVEDTMSQLRTQVGNLQPAPVVVTVAHPEAEVRNTARGGWVSTETSTAADS